MSYPDLTDWNGTKPNEADAAAVDLAESLSWTSIELLTAGRVAFEAITVRPTEVGDDGAFHLDGPVSGVVSVVEAGVPATDWRVDAPNLLVRLNDGVWTANDDLTLPSGTTGVTEVTYWRGWRPGRLLVWAAGVLALEFYKAAAGIKGCRLPSNVTAVTRQGVSFDLQVPLFDSGRTGIREVDLVLQRYNPNRLGSVPIVASPESIAGNARQMF